VCHILVVSAVTCRHAYMRRIAVMRERDARSYRRDKIFGEHTCLAN